MMSDGQSSKVIYMYYCGQIGSEVERLGWKIDDGLLMNWANRKRSDVYCNMFQKKYEELERAFKQ